MRSMLLQFRSGRSNERTEPMQTQIPFRVFENLADEGKSVSFVQAGAANLGKIS